MSEDIKQELDTTQANPLDLAADVAKHVQLINVVLDTIRATRLHDLDVAKNDYNIENNIDNVGFQFNKVAQLIQVRASFSLKLVPQSEESCQSEDPLSIQASFVLIYSVDTTEYLTEANIQAFAAINGVFNAWPYWREFIQNTGARMGAPGIVVPVFRL